MNEAERYGKETSTDYLALKILMNDLTELSCRREKSSSRAVPQIHADALPSTDFQVRGLGEEVIALREMMMGQRQDLQKQGADLAKMQATLEVGCVSSWERESLCAARVSRGCFILTA